MIHYKYRDYGQRTLEILLNRELYFSTAEGLNDPLDSQIDIHAEYKKVVESIDPKKDGKTNQKAFLLHLLNAHRFQTDDQQKQVGLNETMQKYLRSVGVFSLSRTAIDPLLWSHYAAGHAGICLGFDVTQIASPKIVIRNDINYLLHPPYKSLFLELADELGSFVKPWDNHQYDDKLADDFYTRQIEKIMDANLFVKAARWEYEKEYRLIRSSSGFEEFPAGALQTIILGTRSTYLTKRTIARVLKNPGYEHVRLQRVVHVAGSFDFGLLDV